MNSNPRITVSVVTYNSAEHLEECIMALLKQEGVQLYIVVVDNGSTDDSLAIADRLAVAASDRGVALEVAKTSKNIGYGGGHNIAIRRATTPFVFCLNPDATLQGDDCLFKLARALRFDPLASSAGPRFYLKGRPGHLDSTGLQFSRDRRVVDREKSEKDVGQYMESEVVFGVTGAAVLFRRSALADVAELRRGGGVEYFDEDFFMYKEDVDLCWRFNNLGWRHWYVPNARVLHGRSTQGRSEEEGIVMGRAYRKTINPAMLRYAFRNHHVMVIKNERLLHVLRDFFWIAWRELLFLGNTIVFERSTLPAYWDIVKLAPRAYSLRRSAAKRWRVGWRDIARLFVSSRFLFWIPQQKKRR